MVQVVMIHTHLIPELRRQRQADLCMLEASLVSPKTARTVTLRNLVLRKNRRRGEGVMGRERERNIIRISRGTALETLQ